MECCFLGINKQKCIYGLKCQGIYQLILELGGEKEFAANYSRYTWLRSFLNKISDKSKDPARGLIGNTIKILSKIFTPIIRFFIRDVYGIDNLISKVESEVEIFENLEFIFDPMDYFNKVGEGYAIIFQYAAIGAHSEIKTIKKMEKLGQTLGTLISFRDSVQDLKRDRITGSFNPFKNWKYENILLYYQNNSKKLIEKINKIIENIPLKVNIKNETTISNNSYINNQPQALGSLVKYASISTTPFLGCRTKQTAQPLQINCYDLFSQIDVQNLIFPFIIVSMLSVILMICFNRTCGGGERRNVGTSGSSIGSGVSSGGSECGDCNCMATECSDCGFGDCGGCDCGGCDCGGCDVGGCDC